MALPAFSRRYLFCAVATCALTAIAYSQSPFPTNDSAQPPANSQAPTSSAADSPVTLTECEGPDHCATWTFLGTQGNGQWPSGDLANLLVEKFDPNSVVIRRSDSTGPSVGLRAVYTGTRKGNRLEGEYKSSWPGHWTHQEGNWYATIEAPQSIPAVVRVCDNIRCGTLTWDNGLYDAVWADIPHISTIAVVSFRPDLVEMQMTDHTDGKTYSIKGKISSDRNSIINGEVWGTNNNYYNHFSAYWGAALRDHPPTTARQTQPQSQPVIVPVVPIVPAVCFPWFFGVVCG